MLIAYGKVKSFLETNKFIVTCILLAIIVQLALIVLLPLVPTSDADFYFKSAMSIANGVGYVDPGRGDHLTAYWPVGYPGFLAVLFTCFKSSVFVAQFANLVCSFIILLTTISLTQHLFMNKLISNLTALTLSFYPNYIAYNACLLSELFLTAMLMSGIFLYVKYQSNKMAIVTGILFGIVVLTKPQFILIPSLLAILLLLHSKNTILFRALFKQYIIVSLVAILTLVPWIYRCYAEFHSFVFISTNGGINLYIGNNPHATGTYQDVSVKNSMQTNEVTLDHQFRRAAIRFIKENPLQFIRLLPIKMYYTWIKDGEAEYNYQSGYRNYKKAYIEFRVARIFNQVYYGLIMFMAFVGVFLILKDKKYTNNKLVLFGVVYFVYLSIISSIFFGESRYHFPVMPWLIMYSSYALAYFIDTNLGRILVGMRYI